MKITKAHADFIALVNKELIELGCHHPVEGEAEQRFVKMAMFRAPFIALVIMTARGLDINQDGQSNYGATFERWAAAGDAKHNLAYGLGLLSACYQF